MDFLKDLLKKLGFYNHSKYMELSMTQDNLKAMKLISALGIFMAIMFLRVSFTDSGYDSMLYRTVNITSLVICAVIFTLMRYCQKHQLKSFHALHACMFLYIVWMTFSAGVIACIDSFNKGGFIVFLTSQVMCFDLIMIPPFVTVFFSGFNFVAFISIIANLIEVPSIKYVEVLIFYVIVVAVNYFHYRTALLKINKEERMIDDNERLDHLSTTDALTEVRNRTGLRVDFNHLLSDSLCVMMFDVDNFKKYNDLYGHDVGDEILHSFAHALIEVFGNEGIYRYGGDEFLIIRDLSKYHYHIEQMIMKAEFLYTNMSFEKIERPTCSCGYVVGACHSTDALRQMIKASDVQLYKAKGKGKNQISWAAFNEKGRIYR